MKNKLWKQWMISGVLVSAMVVSGGVSVSVQAEETTETEEAAETRTPLIIHCFHNLFFI